MIIKMYFVLGRKKKAAPPPPPVLKSSASVINLVAPSPVVVASQAPVPIPPAGKLSHFFQRSLSCTSVQRSPDKRPKSGTNDTIFNFNFIPRGFDFLKPFGQKRDSFSMKKGTVTLGMIYSENQVYSSVSEINDKFSIVDTDVLNKSDCEVLDHPQITQKCISVSPPSSPLFKEINVALENNSNVVSPIENCQDNKTDSEEIIVENNSNIEVDTIEKSQENEIDYSQKESINSYEETEISDHTSVDNDNNIIDSDCTICEVETSHIKESNQSDNSSNSSDIIINNISDPQILKSKDSSSESSCQSPKISNINNSFQISESEASSLEDISPLSNCSSALETMNSENNNIIKEVTSKFSEDEDCCDHYNFSQDQSSPNFTDGSLIESKEIDSQTSIASPSPVNEPENTNGVEDDNFTPPILEAYNITRNSSRRKFGSSRKLNTNKENNNIRSCGIFNKDIFKKKASDENWKQFIVKLDNIMINRSVEYL